MVFGQLATQLEPRFKAFSGGTARPRRRGYHHIVLIFNGTL
jgi:hypothetical protein